MLTDNTTSSVVEPQEGWLVLVTVKRKVTVPVPLTLTEVTAVPGLRMLATADPVEPTTLHCGVPPEAEPFTVNTVGSPMRQADKSAPALAVAAGLSVTLAELLALQPPGALTETDNTVVPLSPAVQVTVREVCPLMIVPLVIVQL